MFNLKVIDSFENYCHKVESTSTWGGQPEVSQIFQPSPNLRY